MFDEIDALWSKYEKSIARLLVIIVILAAAWYAFVVLIELPVDAASALLMVWLSVAVLIVAIYPEITDRIKRIKIGDFEFELREVVAEAKKEHFISVLDQEQDRYPIFAEKGGLRVLERTLSRSTHDPSRPVLLVVNVNTQAGPVSIRMLSFYLFFLTTWVRNDVAVLFINQGTRVTDVSQISADAVTGIMPGSELLQNFYALFPDLHPALLQASSAPLQSFQAEELGPGFRFPSHALLADSYETFRLRFWPESWRRREDDGLRETARAEMNEQDNGRLSDRDIAAWFGDRLDTAQISPDFSETDIKTLREALAREDTYVIVFEQKRLVAILPLCKLAGQISLKALAVAEQ